MIKEANLEELRILGLMRHQAVFMARFLDDNFPAHHLLVGPVGTGKSFLARDLCRHMFSIGLANRILIVATSSLCKRYMESLLRTAGSDAVAVVDVRKFRAMEAAVEVGANPWPTPFIAILSENIAKREQIASSLVATQWDLLVVDEAHRLTGRNLSVIQTMIFGGRASRSLLMTATPTKSLSCIGGQKLTLTEWGVNEIDWTGNILRPREPVQTLVGLTRTKEEINFLKAILSFLAPVTIENSESNRLFSVLLARRAASSVFAVEQTLERMKRMRDEVLHGHPLAIQEDLLIAETDWQIEDHVKLTTLFQDVVEIEHLLHLIDEIRSDKKMERLCQLLEELTNQIRGVQEKICIFSSYSDTVLYVESALSDKDWDVFSLTGSNSAEEITAALQFIKESKRQAILVTSITEGLEVGDMDVLIHYDLPGTETEIEQRRGRFNRWGRRTPLKEFAFWDKSGVLQFEHDLLKKYFPSLCA